MNHKFNTWLRVLVALLLVLPVALASAASLTWDTAAGDGAVITDGSGNWIDGGAGWNNAGVDTTWSNAAPDQAIFGGGSLGAAGTVTLTGAITAGGITFNTPNGGGNYVVTGNILTLANGSPIVVNAAGTSQINSTIVVATGGNNFLVSGAGDLTLGGQVGNGTQIQAVMNGTGTLTLGDNVTVVDNNNLGLTVNSGTVLLNKPNSGSGHAVGANMTITGGTVRLAGSGGDQIYTQLDVVNNGTFDMAGMSEGFDGLSGSGSFVNSGAGASTLTVGEANTGGTFSGTISGAITFSKNGTGVLTLSGANSYTGATNVNGGTLTLSGGAGRLGTGTYLNLANTAGVTADLAGGSETVLYLTGGGTTGGTLTNTGAHSVLTLDMQSQLLGTQVFGGTITGDVQVVVKNSNRKNNDVQTFTGTNTFTGGILIDNGHLRATSDASLGALPGSFDPQNITIQNGGVLQNNDSYLVTDVNRGIYLAGGDAIIYAGWTKDVTINGVISGPGRLLKNDGGALILTAANTFTGDTAFTTASGSGPGTIRLTNALALQNSTFDATSASGGNGTLDLNGLSPTLGGLKGGGATISNFTGTLSVGNNNQSNTFSGTLSGTGNFTKIGSGTQILSGNNNYSGQTTISDGVLQIGAGGAGGSLGTGDVIDNASLAYNRSDSITVANTITGIGSLTKLGGGEVILSNTANAYSGGTTVSAGLLRATDLTIGTGGLTLQSGGIFFHVSGSGGGAFFDSDFGRTVTLGAGGGGFRSGWGNMTLSGQLTGVGSFTVVNDGIIALTNTGNNYGGDTIIGAGGSGNNATLNLGASEVIPNGAGKGNLVFNASSGGTGAVNLNGYSETINGLSSGGAGACVIDGNSGTPMLTLGDNNAGGTFAGTIRNSAGALSLTKIGTGTQTLAGTITYSGGTTVNGGRLVLQDTKTGSSNFTLGGGTLEFNVTTGSQQLNGGTITGTGTLIKSGAGTLMWGANASVETISLAAGSLIDVREGILRNEYLAGDWTNNKASLNVEPGAFFYLWDANTTIDALTGGGTVEKGQNNTHTLTIGAADGSGTFSGTLKNTSGVMNVTKNGAGTQTFSGTAANTYTGMTTVNAGTLALNKTPGVDAIATGGLTVAGGTVKLLASNQINDAIAVSVAGTFDLNGQNETIRWITGGGSLTNTAGGLGTLTMNQLNSGGQSFAGVISGNTRLVFLNATGKNTDTYTLGNNTNSFTGGVVVDNGHLRINEDANLGAVPGSLDPANITLTNGGVLQNNNTTVVLAATRGITLSGGDGVFFTGWSQNITVNGPIAGTGRLVKSDGAALLLNGEGTFTGDTVFSTAGGGGPGTIRIGNTLALQNSTFDASGIGGNGTLDLNNMNVVLGGLKGAGATISNFTQNLQVGRNNQTNTFSGTLGGAGSFTKAGTGTQTLSGTLIDYTGVTTVNSGRLTLLDLDDTWSPSFAIGSGAFLEVNTTARNFAFNNSANTVISGTGTFVKSGPGQLTTGTGGGHAKWAMSGGLIDIQGGTFLNDYNSADTWASNLASMNVASGATVSMVGGNTITVDALTGAGTVQNVNNWGIGVLTVGVNNGSGTFDGVLKDAGGAAALTKNGTGTQTLAGDNTYTGLTRIQQGTLVAAHNDALGTTAVGTVVSDDATLALQGNIAVGAEALTLGHYTAPGKEGLVNRSGVNSFAGAITASAGAGNVGIRSDAGKLTLSGNITLNTSNLVVSGSGDTDITGRIPATILADSEYARTVTTTSGLKAYYRFSDAVGSTVATDSAPGGLLPGTYTGGADSGLGAASVNSILGPGLDLAGSGQQVALTNASTLGMQNHSFTAMAWINADDLTGDKSVFGTNQTGTNVGLHLILRNAQPWMGFYGNDTGGSGTLSTGTWYQMVWRYDLTTGQQAIFVNGALNAQQTGHAAFQGNDIVRIGTWANGNWFNGLIDEAAIFDRVLSDAEIATLYSQRADSYNNTPVNNNLTKRGSGTMTLSGDNTYTGVTTVEEGRLLVNGSITTPVTVNAGAILGGTGRVLGTVSGAGLVSPGASPGTLTVTQIDPSGGLDFAFQYTNPTGSTVGNDLLSLSSPAQPFLAPLDGENTINIYLTLAGLNQGDLFVGGFGVEGGNDLLAAVSGANWRYWILGAGPNQVTFEGLTYIPLHDFNVDYFFTRTVGQDGILVLQTEVPEPATMTLLGLAAAGIGGYLRRRRRA